MLEVVVRDRRGRIIGRRRKRAGYLSNFTQRVRIAFGGVSGTCKDITGTSRSVGPGITATSPIVRVGSGSTPQTPGDYKLETELGTTPASIGAMVVVGSNSQFTISGSVTLASGGTVREVGYSHVEATYTYLELRDVVPEIVVPLGGTATVLYTLIFTV